MSASPVAALISVASSLEFPRQPPGVVIEEKKRRKGAPPYVSILVYI